VTMTTTAATGADRRRRSTLDRATALRLAATEYARYLDQLRSLDPEDWSRSTACPAWDVRDMAAHNLGMAEMAGSLPEMVRQFSGSARRDEAGVDALTAYQVEERRALTPAEIIDRYAQALPRAVRGRRRRSTLIGRATMPEKQVINGTEESWTFGYLFETILTRDTWMHRVDTAEATGQPLLLTAEHDGVLVADVVTEWAARHGAPFTLHLTGPAGGHWQVGEGGTELTMDAVLFARTLSGRAAGEGLLAVEVPF
jgi:uncharacterized protein (TIGR03083 family)